MKKRMHPPQKIRESPSRTLALLLALFAAWGLAAIGFAYLAFFTELSGRLFEAAALAALIVLGILLYFGFRSVVKLRRLESMALKARSHIVGATAEYETDIFKIFADVIAERDISSNRELTANLLRNSAELSQLQSQINPHFLYNTLDSIRGQALIENVPDIAEMLESLAQLFRNNTRKVGLLVSLAEELKSVDNYMFIQKFRFRERFSFEKHIDDMQLHRCYIPNFIIQPILENAISHGLEERTEGGRIVLRVSSTQSRLIIKVTDNGVGIEDKKLREMLARLNDGEALEVDGYSHSGIGIFNINKRIKLQYGDKYGLSIASTLNVGTTLEITLPLDGRKPTRKSAGQGEAEL